MGSNRRIARRWKMAFREECMAASMLRLQHRNGTAESEALATISDISDQWRY
jgi:hypothetical protein